MLKRLWLIFGPIFIAGFLVLLLIFFYPGTTSHNLTEENTRRLLLVQRVLKREAKK